MRTSDYFSKTNQTEENELVRPEVDMVVLDVIIVVGTAVEEEETSCKLYICTGLIRGAG